MNYEYRAPTMDALHCSSGVTGVTLRLGVQTNDMWGVAVSVPKNLCESVQSVVCTNKLLYSPPLRAERNRSSACEVSAK